ncbi:tRNA (adenosine(37)-N6)-threonylcarbamoyltransferase complex dimerization subunit type 1 TsaB [Neptunitalea lumnitzerae]|uniref:tRNA (Adenosine(37)-N6)-threonylcarbamoyltransferase complex dimerization subunit type 1 TsaB n=1 Tax=Neptunitalea lumnitzerae TaxID=2965509 RepID=A0ABQ5MMU5_9FLAO|nr:tRNA (adenosine(37)-N6)-threonylcarbamoyltransferase complex dimerization subunit type 1 TsaB [Neptunitalea sp. Y10]GLB50662.1 tRNA (adenosine(37)-N6)-threonylcarbamoyltransferase complex dimerization subunit type 1 TsaB [Neptunitalea sp. Y10]
MGYILSIETSGTNCSVALSVAGEVKVLKEENTGNFSHAEKLHAFIKDIIEHANVAVEAIDAVAVSKGPGSYTGLRIGVSAAKGLCFAWDKPLIAVSTLEALAYQGKERAVDYIIPLLDARRMEVYAAIFTSDMVLEKETTAVIVDETSFKEFLDKGTVLFLGDGAEKCKEVFTSANARFLDGKFPSAAEVGQIAFTKFTQQAFEDVAYFEPFYLKDFVAGRK